MGLLGYDRQMKSKATIAIPITMPADRAAALRAHLEKEFETLDITYKGTDKPRAHVTSLEGDFGAFGKIDSDEGHSASLVGIARELAKFQDPGAPS